MTIKLASTTPNRILAVAQNASQSLQNISPKIIPLDIDLDVLENLTNIKSIIGDGKIRSLVYLAQNNNFSVGMENSTFGEFESLMKSNVGVPYFLIRELIPHFAVGAKIVFAFSAFGSEYLMPIPMYTMSRSAYLMCVKILKAELKNLHITIADPGVVKTEGFEKFCNKLTGLQAIPESELLQPEVAADFFIYLLSDSVTGQELSSKEMWSISDSSHQSAWAQGRKITDPSKILEPAIKAQLST